MAISPYPRAARQYEVFRESIWSQATPVASGGRPDFILDELEVQTRWFGGEYGRVFNGTEGERIEVVQFGHWNRGAGPDFTEAAIRVNGELRKGAVEVDLDVRNWVKHGHAGNAAFNGTVLHVFTDQPALSRVFTRTEANANIVQLLLPQYSGLQGPPDFLPEAFPGRCLTPLAKMEVAEVDSLLLSAAQFRLRRKSERLHVMAEATTAEQALFQAVAEALGFRHNKTSMAVLAQRCPVRELLSMAPGEREARLFGTAGFLEAVPGRTTGNLQTKTYERALWDHWWRVRPDAEIAPHRAIRWRNDGTRPLNHPQRRLGTLAVILGHWDPLRELWEKPVNNFPKIVNNWSKALTHPYWNRHYSLASETIPKPVRLLGKDRLRDLLGNVVFPGAIRVSPDRWEEYQRLGGVDTNQKLRRAVLRLFGSDRERQKLFTRYYHQQQGLLQIYEDFCLEDASDCRHCPFPEQLLQWRQPLRPGGGIELIRAADGNV